MKKNKFSEQSKKVLNLVDTQKQIELERQHKRNKILPLFFLLVGVFMIFSGAFFSDIKEFIDNNTKKEQIKKPEINKETGITILSCEFKKEDSSLGLSSKTSVDYTFNKNLLKKVNVIYTFKVMNNSRDIGISNINIFYNKYNEVSKLLNFEGIKSETTFKDEILKSSIDANLEILDLNRIPKNNYLNIYVRKDQTFREIKEIEGRALHVCKVIEK